MIIREASNQDADEISALIFDIWTNEYHFDINKEDYPDLKQIQKYYSDSGGLFLVALMNAHTIGTIACEKLDINHYVLKRMFVAKEYRGQGVAQSLLYALFQRVVYSKEQYPISFTLSTKADDAVAAKKFYLKNGFRTISRSELPDKFPFFYQDDLFMIKDSWDIT